MSPARQPQKRWLWKAYAALAVTFLSVLVFHVSQHDTFETCLYSIQVALCSGLTVSTFVSRQDGPRDPAPAPDEPQSR